MKDFLKKKIEEFVNTKISEKDLRDWARDLYYDIIDNKEKLFSLRCITVVPLLSEIAFREPDDVFSLEDAKRIQRILNGNEFYNYFFRIQLEERSDKRIERIRTVLNNNDIEYELLGCLENEKIFEPADLYDMVYQNLRELVLTKSCYNEINVRVPNKRESIEEDFLLIYSGKKSFNINLMYTEYGLVINLII